MMDYLTMKRLASKDFKIRANLKGMADQIMDTTSNTPAVREAMSFYRMLGMDDKPSVKRKLLNYAERQIKKSKEDPDEIIENIRSYLQSNGPKQLSSAREPSKAKGLERKSLAIIGGTGILASLFFLSPVVTGNAISLNNQVSFSIGTILFLLGLVGLFVGFRNK